MPLSFLAELRLFSALELCALGQRSRLSGLLFLLLTKGKESMSYIILGTVGSFLAALGGERLCTLESVAHTQSDAEYKGV